MKDNYLQGIRGYSLTPLFYPGGEDDLDMTVRFLSEPSSDHIRVLIPTRDKKDVYVEMSEW